MSNTNPNLPTPAINAATYYDVLSEQLNLAITYPSGVSRWPKGIIVHLITPPSTNPTKLGNGPPTFPANSNTGNMVLPLALASASAQGAQITVASLDASWESSTPSDPWKIPAIKSLPFTGPASVSFTSLGCVQVAWSWYSRMSTTAQQVTLIIAGHDPVTTMVKNTNPGGPATATFTMAQASNLFTPGKEITIRCIPATPVYTTFSIPKSSWMASYSFNNSPPVSSGCTMTSLPVQGTTTMQVWWGTPQGAIETAMFPDGNPEQFAEVSTISDAGSCLASIYVSSTNQQVWWITQSGAIDGQINSGKGWTSPGTGPGEAIPFNVANIASTVNGGSTTGLVLEGNIGAILFWVAPQGAIKCCRWLASSGWQTVFDALPPGAAIATTQLSVLSVGSSAYLFCVASGGAVVGASWPDASSDSLGPMSQFAVPSSGNATPKGGLNSFGVSPQEIAVLWTTADNNIKMALVFPGASFRNIQQPLTVPQSVLGGTGIAAYSLGGNQYSIWWIGQLNDLRRTNVDLTKFQATSTPDWPVFEELGPGSCKQTRSFIIQSVSRTQIDLLYVNANDDVAGLSYAS